MEKYKINNPQNINKRLYDFFTERAGVFNKQEFIEFILYFNE